MDVGQATAGSSPCRNPPSEAKPKGPSGALIFLLAATAGLVVANIYYNQPVLNAIAATFGVGPAAVAWVATATQLGYAAGLLFVVPLGDGIDRKWLIIASTLVSGAVLVLVPISPNLPFMLGASFALGFASVAPQLAIPYAAGLVPGAGRGRVIGTVMSGLLIGVLLSRTTSGLLGTKFSWQVVYWSAAAVMLLLAVVLWIALPSQPAHAAQPYGRLLASLPRLLWTEPIIRRHSILGALGFQYLGNLPPCEMCHWQRWPHIAAAVMGIAGGTYVARRPGEAAVPLAIFTLFETPRRTVAKRDNGPDYGSRVPAGRDLAALHS